MLEIFFGSKIEKELKHLVKTAPELEVRYAGEENFTISQLRRVYRDSIVISGFSGQLRKKELEVRILANMATFQTTVIKTGTDQVGLPIFYCKIPAKFKAGSAAARKRYHVFPEGKIRVLLTTNRGEKGVELPIWDIGEGGISILNTSDVGFKLGTKLYQSLVTIGSGSQQLIDLQIINIKKQVEGGKAYQLMMCRYQKQPRAMNEIINAAKSVSPKR
ncbi:hypothetical protein SCOR_18415 [Sulfidibacter corallicola]|uniref:PilZ domain-containing protein n=1 Tax=Sulfidibacter corallicola TaxID=2818388 RepID=A0A8A4U4A2_SULCO|nr:hypothetical protein [Sulfidibacter corallicola]QTD53575.1 hypothetical protein J3U87_14060 [Sulfidibacter corallicola]